jgi:UDP-N-acetyl-D-mannosaminuronic acid dehydrogenase
VIAHGGHYEVTLLDTDVNKVKMVNEGIAPFMEEGLDQLLKKVAGKSLHATDDNSCLKTAEIVITTIGTPVDPHLNPTVYVFKDTIDSMVESMAPGSLLILRSTIYPGVTKLIYERVKRLGKNVHISFCPERIAEGKAIEELTNLPQIVAAFDDESMQLAGQFFSTITQKVLYLTPLEAELAKLFTNSWRYLNFAISNQFYILAQTYGLDFYRIYDAVRADYPRMNSFAKAGFAAGPCLLKDTLQLAAFANNNFFLGHSAMLVNEGFPKFIVDQLQAFDLSEKKVAILGMAFKANCDDNRDSLSYKLRHLLRVYARKVLCTDPYVKDASLVPLEKAVEEADIIILGAPHSLYKDLRFAAEKTVIDIWGFWPASHDKLTAENAQALPVRQESLR